MKRLGTLIFLCVLVAGAMAAGAPAHAEAVLKYGSSGDYVWDLQYRLKTLSLFDQEMTGYFGSHTGRRS